VVLQELDVFPIQMLKIWRILLGELCQLDQDRMSHKLSFEFVRGVPWARAGYSNSFQCVAASKAATRRIHQKLGDREGGGDDDGTYQLF
jgi:hypothetical protein